jgi:hypothetical protein
MPAWPCSRGSGSVLSINPPCPHACWESP